MKLKICGIRSFDALDTCQSLGVDFVGINFVKTSKRKAENSFYHNISKNQKTLIVGVFQDNDLHDICQAIEASQLDILQLHGQESPKLIEEVQAKHPQITVWKAFSINENFNKTNLQYYSKNCELFLFDGSSPGSGSQILDNTKLADAILESQHLGVNFGIAGGINVENIAQFAQHYPQATLLDTASGVETNGVFDPQKATTLKAALA